MAIGYIGNLSNLQAGNQQVVNSLTGLGQQIAGAIETHAATQSAQAMLPSLQAQVAQGMQKIAAGHSEGLNDVYSAALTASQNPLLAPMANHALNMANMANVQKQHSLRTYANIGARMVNAGVEKPMTAYQQAQMAKTAAQQKNTQIDEYNAMYAGDPKNNIQGIGALAEKINKSIKDGTDVSPDDLRSFGAMYGAYRQKQAAYGDNAVSNENINQAYNDIKGHLQTAQQELDNKIKKLPEGSDPSKVSVPGAIFGNLWPNQVDLASQKKNIDTTLQNLDAIHNIGTHGKTAGGLPAAQGSSAQSLIQAVQAAKKHPDKIDLIKNRLQGAGIDPSLLDKAIESQQNQGQSAPQASNMIPAANQVASNGEAEDTEDQTSDATETGEEA